LGLTAPEVVEVFRRLLSVNNVSQVIVSTGDLQARIAEAAKPDSSARFRGRDGPGNFHSPEMPPADSAAGPGGRHEEKLGPIESKIAEIWTEVLKLEYVNSDDNFFQLGGQSILAIQVIERINQAFQVNLTMRALFDESTIASLAMLVEEFIIDKLEAESEQEFTAPV
jgi:acyl carrier protein